MYAFIGCSSSDKIDDIYKEKAKLISSFLAKEGFNLITGGIDGVMGLIQKEFVKYRRDLIVLGVDAYILNESDYKYNLYNYKNISLRKQAIINMADLIVFMPGGIGTFDELFTIIESKRACEHSKPILILNINNYYDNLIEMLDNMYNNNFANINDKKYYYIINDLDEFTTIFNNIEWKDIYD